MSRLYFQLFSSRADSKSYFVPEMHFIYVYVIAPEVRKSPLKDTALKDPLKAIPL